MNGTSGTSAAGRLHAALARPVFQRCSEVANILSDTSIKELYTILPTLIESIFGFNNQPGWGINTCRVQYQDFRELRYLLGPKGPLLTAIYRMCSDPYLKYEFPVACLPLSTQKSLEEGHAGQFYSNKIQLTHTGRAHNMLRLNPFEFYFFHFTHFLVGPSTSRGSTWVNPADALYPVLLEDYLHFFLPLDDSPPPSAPSVNASAVKSPIAHHYSPMPRQRQSPSTNSPSQRFSPFSGLLRTVRSPAASNQGNANGGPVVNDAPEEQTWRSQTFLQVLVEQWMSTSGYDVEQITLSQSNQQWYGNKNNMASFDSFRSRGPFNQSRDRYSSQIDSRDQYVTNFNTSRDYYQTSSFDVSYISPPHDPYHYFILESQLASLEQIRLVRSLIKHLHFFVNTARPPAVTSQYTANVANPWNEFKRSVMPQKKIYQFLKHNFERWPLDSSFRMVMETWLSFIQPWRYSDPTQAKQRESEQADVAIDDKWRSFVMENLLFYTVLFESFVQRALRLDLCSTKNAQLAFRVAKIFSLPRLRELIEDAEQCLFSPSSRSHHHHQTSFHGSPHHHHHHGSSSFLGASPIRHPHAQLASSSMTLQFTELEGPMFEYQPMFSQATKNMAGQLILQMSEAKHKAQETSPKPSHNDSSFLSFLGFNSNPDLNATSVSCSPFDDYGGGSGGGNELKRLDVHLENAIANLCRLFDFHVPDKSNLDKSVSFAQMKTPLRNGRADTLTPDVCMTDDGPKLSPLGRYQLVNGLRRFDVAYEGDPDTQPIRSFESPVLVRFTHELATFINQRFGALIWNLNYGTDFKSRMAQQFISLPYPDSPAENSLHLSPTSKQRRKDLNYPRVRLRWLASYQTMGYVFAFYVFMYMWFGFGPVVATVLLVLLVALYAPLMAVLRGSGKGATKMKKT